MVQVNMVYNDFLASFFSFELTSDCSKVLTILIQLIMYFLLLLLLFIQVYW